MPYKDPNKRRNYHREYIKNKYKNDPIYRLMHRQRTKINNAKYKQQRQKLIDDFRKNGCSFCAEKDSCCMDAHHIENKEFNIGDMNGRKLSADRISKELEKCICVCKNCHAKIHAGLLVAE